MSRRAFFPILVAVSWLVAGPSCDRGQPALPVTNRPDGAARPGVSEVDLEGMKTAVARRIYVPAYSHILTSDDARPYNLAVTLSVRNTDDVRPIIVRRVHYHDQDGRLIRDYLKKPLKITPMASIDFFVKESDTSGGSSASFLVEWSAEEPVSEPVVEAVMIGTAGTQGISFTSPGRVLTRGEPGP